MSIPLALILLLYPDSLWTEEAPGYTISVSFEGSLLSDSVLAGLLKEHAEGLVGDFRRACIDLITEYPEPMPWSLEVSYTHEPSPRGLICALAWMWDYTGGAHGNSWTAAFVFDTEGDSLVDPLSFFPDREAFASFAGDVARNLRQELGEDFWIERGASPTADNYRCMLPVPDSTGAVLGYRVLFPPYQVAPYAWGPQEVFIPVAR